MDSTVMLIKQQRDTADDLVLWALGELGGFPDVPADWPKRPFYWRRTLRAKFDALQIARSSDATLVTQ